MPRNRFQFLLTSLHFVNNMTVSETEKKDKLWKLRLWLDSFREKYLQVAPEEHNSVDEMMIPFKGKFSSIKQYMRGKPNPWGLKMWVRTGISGMMYDVDVYQGSVDGIRAKSELRLSVKLLDRGIHYVGTARQVRLLNCNIEDEKSLKKKGRGSYDVRVERNQNICAVKWYDSRADTFVSSFAGPEPVQKIKRWDKANRTYIEVERPYIVGAYNKYMGGVGLLDSAKYKFPIKSRRWYMYIFWHAIILAVVNAWLLYKRDCEALKVSSKVTMNKRPFQAQLASSLILVNATLETPKRGRPSSGKGSPATQTVTSGSPLNAQKRPFKRCAHLPLDVHKDLVAHFPRKTGRGRCRHCNTGYTNTQCRKCYVRLCFTDDRDCF
ncbi:piggyBac transposable element-derived protein 2-like [Entelurus aequoreus]|uniref:piggyBac transposable element-derived protein 2-like n=1 Tax=Entelurus aequoreus TaxID=161455 RepID=UPI002B1DDC2D|nr:piggyBac transposable element-derived protein 2-like [Entelurus aequoreus]